MLNPDYRKLTLWVALGRQIQLLIQVYEGQIFAWNDRVEEILQRLEPGEVIYNRRALTRLIHVCDSGAPVSLLTIKPACVLAAAVTSGP